MKIWSNFEHSKVQNYDLANVNKEKNLILIYHFILQQY
jgi:hypothetical protein